MLKRHNQFFLFLFRLADSLILLLAWLGGYLLRQMAGAMGWTDYPMPAVNQLFTAIGISLILQIILFGNAGLYTPKRSYPLWREIAMLLRCIIYVTILSLFIHVIFTHELISRFLFGFTFASWVFLAIVERYWLRKLLQRLRTKGLNQRYAAIIGTGKLAQKTCHALEKHTWAGIQVRCFITSDSHKTELWDKPVYHMGEKTIDQLMDQIQVDIVFLALAGKSYDQTEQLLNQLSQKHVDVYLVPDLLSAQMLTGDMTEIQGMSMVSIGGSPIYGWPGLFKRLIDIAFSFTGLLLLSPVMALIALAVKRTSQGPIFYSQVRTSLSGKPFRIYKFRTMRVDAEQETGPVWSKQNDSRQTKLGCFLRKYSLDELPQLFNVLIGHMSLVGPRPERPELIKQFDQVIPRYQLRHKVKAGLTGWAQINGYRGDTSLRKRIQYDLYYIRNWSLGLDLWIMIMTLFRIKTPPTS